MLIATSMQLFILKYDLAVVSLCVVPDLSVKVFSKQGLVEGVRLV